MNSNPIHIPDLTARANMATARAQQAPKVLNVAVRNMESAVDNDDPEGMLESARALEGVFISMVFNEMAKTVSKEDGLFPSTPGSEMFEQWFRTEVGNQWASAGGAGLGDSIAVSMGMDRAQIEEVNAEMTRTRANAAYQQNN
jgi:Rod binding domain-containing protein